MNFTKLMMTFHFEVERGERREMISAIFGTDYGMPVCKIRDEEKQRWHYLTSNGIRFIVNDAETILITAFIVSMSQAKEMYRIAGEHMPNSMVKRIQKNQIKIQKFNEKKLEKRLDNLRIA